jgi:translation initiation factor 2-alpha kinase 4
MRPPLASPPAESYDQAQEDEREVLKAIFMDDYEESEATGAWSVSCSLDGGVCCDACQHTC